MITLVTTVEQLESCGVLMGKLPQYNSNKAGQPTLHDLWTAARVKATELGLSEPIIAVDAWLIPPRKPDIPVIVGRLLSRQFYVDWALRILQRAGNDPQVYLLDGAKFAVTSEHLPTD
jgi:hypothetical protein